MSSNVTGLISWLRGWFDDIYQAKLVSGTNIKTINNNSLLGSGDIAISAGSNEETLEYMQKYVGEWHPLLNGETGAVNQYSYSESNGEGVGKGFLLNHGFLNTDNWQLYFEFKHDNIRYTGINFLAMLGTTPQGSNRLGSWEGSWPGGSAYASYNSGAVGWFDVTVTKIDSTHIRLQSKALNRDTNVELSWLPNATFLTCGASHNTNSSSYGPCRIRNVKVIRYVPILDIVYPVGSIYMGVNDVNPANLFGGTWEQIKDKFLLASGDSYANGATGGSKDAVIVQHNHTAGKYDAYTIENKDVVTGKGTPAVTIKTSSSTSSSRISTNSTGESGTDKNMPPYLVVNIWKRTA